MPRPSSRSSSTSIRLGCRRSSGCCSSSPGRETIVLTTPNREYNVTWETLPAGKFRHPDHRFEWTRQQFQDWANVDRRRFGYAVRFLPVGPEDSDVGSPTQMGVFEVH